MASSPSEHEIQQRIRLTCGRGQVQRNKAGALLDREDQLTHLRAAAGARAGTRGYKPGWARHV